MTTHAPMARVPFAPLDNPRLQHLASAKNRQNGLISQKSAFSGGSNLTPTKSVLSPKRPLNSTTFDDYDSENVDPAIFTSPVKKSKSGILETPVTFSLTSAKPMHPPPTIPSRLSTPIRANMSSPRAPLTAPAGRSPKRRTAGITRYRRTSAPFTRIDPPFASSGSSMPFSLDAALKGTFSSPGPKSAGATIQESMPRNWFFEIHQDTPEEEAANLMEHSTLTLDLSSDEESKKREKADRGKENMPPEGYDAPAASRPVDAPTIAAPKHVKKTEIVRVKVPSDEMDDGQRSPLSDLETEPFFPDGLNRETTVVVDGTPEKATSAADMLDVEQLFAMPMQLTTESAKIASASPDVAVSPAVDHEGHVKSEIIVWEDSRVSEHAFSPARVSSDLKSAKEVEVADENSAPIAELL